MGYVSHHITPLVNNCLGVPGLKSNKPVLSKNFEFKKRVGFDHHDKK